MPPPGWGCPNNRLNRVDAHLWALGYSYNTTPLPVPDFRQILTMLVDVVLALDEPVAAVRRYASPNHFRASVASA